MVSRAWWRVVLGVGVLAMGCSYTLAPPDIVRDAAADRAAPTDRAPVDSAVEDVTADAAVDRVSPTDTPVPVDAGTDVGADAGFDTGTAVDAGNPDDTGPGPDAPDAGFDVPVGDLGRDAGPTDTGLPQDTGTPDVGVDAGPAADAGSCTPTARRLCWTGPSAARGQGVCRDGVETCLGSGTWGPCEGQILPDCAGRVCGSNGCGGSCGNCLQGEVCDDTGRCGTPVCGASNFTTTCPGGFTCPANGRCNTDRSCGCLDGYVAQRCDGVSCGGTCSFPNWYCARAAFCGGSAIVCPGGYLCPRWARCDTDTRSCACLPGFRAVECSGVACQNCPGTAYRCQRI